MNILMLGWELPPDNSGGLGVACYHMSKALALRGLTIDFVVPYRPRTRYEHFEVHSTTSLPIEAINPVLAAYGQPCTDCNERSCEHFITPDVRALQAGYQTYVTQLVRESPPDVIHAHDWLTFEAGMQAKRLTGRPLIAHVHATEYDRAGQGTGNPLVHDIEYNGLMMADHIVAVSQSTKDLIVSKYRIPADKISVVHNTVEAETSVPIDAVNAYHYLEAMKRRGFTVVVSLGRLTIQKGLIYLLQAAQLIVQKNPRVLFLIAGAGEQRDELIEMSANLGIARNVLFSGFVRGKAWRDTYRIADVFVMSSVSEPFGLTALEAAQTGTALCLSKQAGVTEVLHNTFQFDYWDTRQLADQVLGLTKSDNLRRELSDNARDEMAHFSWSKTADKLIALYARHGKAELVEATR